MVIDDAGIKSGLRQSLDEGCSRCLKEPFCIYADGWNSLARDALEYILALESSLKEYMDMEEIRRNRQHASNWVKYWREKHGEMTLAWPDWDEIFKDWEETHTLAQSRLRRMRLFKSRAQRYAIEANHYKWLYKDAMEELETAKDANVHTNQPKWISVCESLPEQNTAVIVAFDDGHVFQGMYAYNNWGLWDGCTGKITHWMPLPEAPKDNKEE